MEHELNLVQDSPKEILLKEVRKKKAERKKALETKRKTDQEKRILQKEEASRKALENRELARERRIKRLKAAFAEQVIELADEYFNFSYQDLKAMPNEQLKELTDLIAYTAKKRLASVLFAPVALPLKFFGWLLKKSYYFDAEAGLTLFFGGAFAFILIGVGAGGGLWGMHYKILSALCWFLGGLPWAMIPSATALKLIGRIESVRNFFEKAAEIDCFGGLRYLYCRHRIKKMLGSAEAANFFGSSEARLL